MPSFNDTQERIYMMNRKLVATAFLCLLCWPMIGMSYEYNEPQYDSSQFTAQGAMQISEMSVAIIAARQAGATKANVKREVTHGPTGRGLTQQEKQLVIQMIDQVYNVDRQYLSGAQQSQFDCRQMYESCMRTRELAKPGNNPFL
jgi:hypothetical protein